MKNFERLPSPFVLATSSAGTVQVAGLTIGTTATAPGAVIAVRTSAGSLMVIPSPASTTATPSEPAAYSQDTAPNQNRIE